MGNGGTIWTACIYVDYICYGRRLWGMAGPYGLHVFMWTTYVTVDVYGEWRDYMNCVYLCGLDMLR